MTKIADGDVFLWCCNCKRNETCENIFEMYADFLQFLQINTVVFDGYSLSTKDDTYKKHSGKASATIEIKETSLCGPIEILFFQIMKIKNLSLNVWP